MDYSQFLSRTETHVLPYFGGPRVELRDRRLRLVGEADPGWWEFEVKGRNARPVRKTEPADLANLPATRGHYACGWLFFNGRELGRVALPPADEPEPLAPCIGRRWYSGHLLLDSVDFEDEAEVEARRALEDGADIAELKGVSPGLRAAFGYALLAQVGRRADVRISPREAAPHVHDVASGGDGAAARVIERLRRQREEWAALLAAEARERQLIETAHAARLRGVRRANDLGNVFERVLMAAGARLLRWRRLAEDSAEVTFEFMDERFISTVDVRTLQVYDAGICLSGADRALTLESLPSAIKEAIETDQLNITRH